MATYHLHRFASPAVLKSIAPEHLRALLWPWESYFAAHGVDLSPDPQPSRPVDLDYDGILRALLADDADVPRDLVDVIYLVDEMSVGWRLEEFLDTHGDAPEVRALRVSQGTTATDLVVQLHAGAPWLLEQAHSEQRVSARREFEYFAARNRPQGPFVPPTPEALSALEADLRAWFRDRLKGVWVSVLVQRHGDEIRFVIRRGERRTRVPAIRSGVPGCFSFRPARDDVVVYDATLGELRVHATTRSERDLYRRLIGFHAFGSFDHFPDGGQKYTLEPLRRDGRASLVCTDVEGLDTVTLVRLAWSSDAPYPEFVVRVTDDVFASLAARDTCIPHDVRLVEARFLVQFTGVRAPRPLTLRTPNIASVSRDEDCHLIEHWLHRRGFVLNIEEFDREEHASVLESHPR